MVTLARNLYVLGSRIFAGLTAVLVAILRHASAWQVRALLRFVACHHHSPYLDCSIGVSPN
jgi:hypothetical protein